MVDTAVQSHQLLYSVPDGAKMVGLSRSTMYVLISSGQCETVQFGRRRLISHQALEDLAQRIAAGEVSL